MSIDHAREAESASTSSRTGPRATERRAAQAGALISAARRLGRRALGEADGKRLLAAFGVAVPRFVVAAGADDVEARLDGIAGPYAVKVLSPDIVHKSDVGGVMLNVTDVRAVRAAVASIAAQAKVRPARVDGYLIEPMCAPGVEVVIGAVRDRRFGPMLMVGLGGVFVEILRDVAFRLCPITRADAHAMLAELRGAPLLEGARGRDPVDRLALVDLLFRIGGKDGLVMSLEPEIAELDLNPVIVSKKGAVAADARFILTDARVDTTRATATSSPQPARDPEAVAEYFRPLFAPRTLAVLGASTSTTTIANTFIRRLGDFGYSGAVYPIHPKADEVEGLRAYPSLAETPEPVDYAYIAIGARAIPDVLRNAKGRLRFAQVISSGFGEVADGAELQDDLVRAGHAGGCRVLGPNCLGLYSPRGGITFPAGAPKDAGTVGVVSQSGGLGTDIIKRGQWRGLRFSSLVTVGNSADIGPADLVEFYFADPCTRVIGLYLEDVKDGRRFFDLLRSPRATKPIVILRGGRSFRGRAAAASHTGAMAGDDRAWDAIARQTCCVLVDTVDRFIDAVLAMQVLELHPQRPTRRVVLFGNGGGTSVLATDSFAECGLDVAPFDTDTLDRLDALKLPPGTSVANPIDAPVATLQADDGGVADRIFDIVYETAAPDAVVMHINLAAFVGRGKDPVDRLIEAAVRVQRTHPGRAHFAIVLRVDGSPELDERRRRYRATALDARIPVYDELVDAAHALRAVRWIEQQANRAAGHASNMRQTSLDQEKDT